MNNATTPGNASNQASDKYQYQTESAKECFYVLNDWLQDAHLTSEAILPDITGRVRMLIWRSCDLHIMA